MSKLTTLSQIRRFLADQTSASHYTRVSPKGLTILLERGDFDLLNIPMRALMPVGASVQIKVATTPRLMVHFALILWQQFKQDVRWAKADYMARLERGCM